MEFTFDEEAQEEINEATYIKAKCIEVESVTFAVDPVPFNKGFYTVDVTFNFSAQIEAYTSSSTLPTLVYGTASFSKKVILFGSDGSTQRFVSGQTSTTVAISQASGCAYCCDCGSLPTAAVNIAPPMCLDASLNTSDDGNIVTITIGIFAIIQLERPVPIMIPAFDYCMPEKECSTNTDSPCELFDKISFPTSEFFPQGLEASGNCCCNETQTDTESDEASTTS